MDLTSADWDTLRRMRKRDRKWRKENENEFAFGNLHVPRGVPPRTHT